MNEETKIYTCPICKIFGTDPDVIAAGFCHRRHQERHRDDIPATITKKKEMKHKFRGTSIKKFNTYFEE